MLSSSRFLACIWLFLGLASAAARLPAEELESLRAIASTLGKLDWSFDGDFDPCQWRPEPEDRAIECNFENDTVSHVTKIYLKRDSLTGSLPVDLGRLPFLQVIDLTRNYLNGTIPPQWGSMQSLTIISLLGNRLTGQIPKELANITGLQELVLEANQFNGTFPAEFGNLPNLKRILISSNNLTGVLPTTLAQLTNLTDFRISDNNFTGSIPTYIQSWTYMGRLEIQASGLSGPIPSNLTSLTRLTDLRISDLNGGQDSAFPLLDPKYPPSRDYVILRSCNLVGEIPPFIQEMKINETLDLSFNKLTGPIPSRLDPDVERIYLLGNSLNGTVPAPLKNKLNIDLSFNNLTVESSDLGCLGNSPNLFANSNGSTSASSYCAETTCKPNDNYFFRINCGGKKVNDYDADDRDLNFYRGSKWGFSSVGDFLNAEKNYESKFFSSPPNNLNISEVYKSARLSPLSLTYFGFCLRNGNYTVQLHFAEIMFTADGTFRSLGRRVFDVYIQRTRVLKDFNIVNAAGGVNKERTESFPAVVHDHTLEIRFYWAGKGTTVLPERSVYGPLISAISVVHDSYRPGSISAGAIAGIVLATLFVVVLVLYILWFKGCLQRKDTMHHGNGSCKLLWIKESLSIALPADLRGLDLHTGSFTLRQIRAATNNFDPGNKIGEGGFGPVYKGVLLDGQVIAVKQLSSKSKQGNREFVNEIGMISALQHPHLVKLYGCCIEGNQLLLVYEYCENNSLARALFGPEAYQLHLDWPTRHAICIGIARGLAYLHEESRLKIVHRDIKATNVLLDGNLVPKISDFGLAKLDEEDNTHISTRIAGTFGYMAPEYAMRGYLTDKADVYSFGVVLLEIVSGRSNSSIRPKEESFYLLDWTNSLKAKGELLELVDPRLESDYNKEEVITAINVALLCTNVIAGERPSMSTVVNMLEGKVSGIPMFGLESKSSATKTKPEEVEMRVQDGEGQSISMDVPWSGSSSSVADLYPVAPDSGYWEKRGL